MGKGAVWVFLKRRLKSFLRTLQIPARKMGVSAVGPQDGAIWKLLQRLVAEALDSQDAAVVVGLTEGFDGIRFTVKRHEFILH